MAGEGQGGEGGAAAGTTPPIVPTTARKVSRPPPPAPPPRSGWTKRTIESRILTMVILFSFGGYFLLTSTTHQTYSSTVNLEPGLVRGIPATLPAGSGISGHFAEASGSPVGLYIMSSAEWASYQNGVDAGSLYTRPDTAAASFAFTTPAADTYYLVLRHGPGLQDTTETVTIDRDYAIPHPTTLAFGLLSVALGGVVAVTVARAWRTFKKQPS